MDIIIFFTSIMRAVVKITFKRIYLKEYIILIFDK